MMSEKSLKKAGSDASSCAGSSSTYAPATESLSSFSSAATHAARGAPSAAASTMKLRRARRRRDEALSARRGCARNRGAGFAGAPPPRAHALVAQVRGRHFAAVHQREGRDAAQHQVLERLGAGGAAVQQAHARRLEPRLPLLAPDAQLPVVAPLLVHARLRHGCAERGSGRPDDRMTQQQLCVATTSDRQTLTPPLPLGAFPCGARSVAGPWRARAAACGRKRPGCEARAARGRSAAWLAPQPLLCRRRLLPAAARQTRWRRRRSRQALRPLRRRQSCQRPPGRPRLARRHASATCAR
jgi:hypothetical protein